MNKPEILALYLPQYYETDYNSEWWGKGYTEWTACKQARPLFKGHYQPRIPQEESYYNLSEKAAIMSQVELAKKYGIDGFVIYQYYSVNDNKYGDKNGKHGRMLLNKPTEIIREDVYKRQVLHQLRQRQYDKSLHGLTVGSLQKLTQILRIVHMVSCRG